MIAGATAVASVGAIALTPIAPAVSLPSLSQIKSEVALSAFADPVSALLNTTAVVGNYFLNGVYGTAAANWPGSGTFLYPDGIGAYVNGGIPGNTGITAPGIIQTAVNNPLPIATALLTNWLGYGYLAGSAALGAAGAVADILWSIPATAVTVGLDLLALNAPQAIADVQAAVQAAISSASDAVNALVNSAATIVSTIAYRGTAALNFMQEAITQLPTLIASQAQLLVGSVTGVFNSVLAASSAANPVEGVWNALVNGLLDATVSGSLPATVINLTAGAGIQYGPVTTAVPPYVVSVRAFGTATLGGLANVLDTTRSGRGLYPPEEDNVITDNDIYWNNYDYRCCSSAPAAAAVAAPAARAARAAAAGDTSSATDQGSSAAANRPKAARAHAARADR